LMARPGRFELPTPWFEAKYSIQLSYRRRCAIIDVMVILITHLSCDRIE
jgi:hypothetical protein